MAQDNFLKVALGSDRYVIDAPFGDLPADLGKVTDIAAGRDGTVFLLTRHDCRSEEARDCVHMLTAEGAYLGSWGRDHIVDAHKLTIDGAGRIWVVDRDAHQIIAFDRAGRVLTSLGRRHCPNEPFNHPTDIAFFPDGGIAVTDGYAGARVHLFSADGQPEGGFGALGRAPRASSWCRTAWASCRATELSWPTVKTGGCRYSRAGARCRACSRSSCGRRMCWLVMTIPSL